MFNDRAEVASHLGPDQVISVTMVDHASLPLNDRIALVIGASRGIGYESALALAKAGAHVIAAARTQGGLEELDDAIFAATGKHATLIPFDLVDGGAIDRLGGAIFERFGKIDIWVQAAATMGQSGLTPVSHAEPREFAKVEKINFTGVYRLIRSLEPLLMASDAGRVVHFTTSVAAAPRAFWGMYAATKAGAEALMKCWADEIESTPVRVSVVDPGRTRTQMRAQAYPGEDPATLPHPSEVAQLVVDLSRPDQTPPLTVSFKEWKQQSSASAA
jgi:NAD(P)-dependent dehydrogenase (short-subunit alcohol dehydrogenase family)